MLKVAKNEVVRIINLSANIMQENAWKLVNTYGVEGYKAKKLSKCSECDDIIKIQVDGVVVLDTSPCFRCTATAKDIYQMLNDRRLPRTA